MSVESPCIYAHGPYKYAPGLCSILFAAPRREKWDQDSAEFAHTGHFVVAWVQTLYDTCSANVNAIDSDTIQAFQPPFVDDSTHQAEGGCYAV